jgi:cell wall-associated NlpC family hydrolase
MGVPYVWGGMSPNGFDCSGFSKYVLSKHGISIPRTAAEQYTAGTSVSKSNLRVGDLVFFTTYKPGPSHLGFYLGNGDFIHASSSKGVTISNLSSTYYSSRYIGARRVIN